MAAYSKKFIHLFFLGLIVLFTSSIALGANEIEPNYSFETANLILPPELTIGSFDHKGDIDVYKINISQGGEVSFKIVPPKGSDPAIEVFDGDGDFQFSINDFPVGEAEQSTNPMKQGEYYILVFDKGDFFSGENYFMEIIPTPDIAPPVFDSFELSHSIFNNNGKNKLTISFNLSEYSYVTGVIFDYRGSIVRKIEKTYWPGIGKMIWDGKNSAGQTAPPGKYTIFLSAIDEFDNESLEVAKEITVKKIISIKKKGITKSNKVKLMNGPGNSYKVLVEVPKDTKLYVYELNGNYYRVKTDKGKTGYIYKDSVKILK